MILQIVCFPSTHSTHGYVMIIKIDRAFVFIIAIQDVYLLLLLKPRSSRHDTKGWHVQGSSHLTRSCLGNNDDFGVVLCTSSHLVSLSRSLFLIAPWLISKEDMVVPLVFSPTIALITLRSSCKRLLIPATILSQRPLSIQNTVECSNAKQGIAGETHLSTIAAILSFEKHVRNSMTQRP